MTSFSTSLRIAFFALLISAAHLHAQTATHSTPDSAQVHTSSPALATSQPAPVLPRMKSFAAGLEATLPMMGLSGMYNVNEKMSGQVIAGLFMGNIKALVGRFLYHFREQSELQFYAFGSLGSWSYSGESTIGIGGGGGIEYFLEDLPDLGLNLEVSLIHADFRTETYRISGITVGGGAHYYF